MSQKRTTDEQSKDYTEANRRLWDELVPAHVASEIYDVDGFKAGANVLGELERAEVGDVAGKRVLHLLCRFGLDTLSWARLGASVTGVDISPKAIATARELALSCALDAEFHCCDVYETPAHVTGTFDVVYMSWGALIWVRDFPALAELIAAFLKPGGFFYALEAHPMGMAVAENWTPQDGPPVLQFDYQTGADPYSYQWEDADYAGAGAELENKQAYEWAHGLGRVVTSLADAGLRLSFLHEHDFGTWQMFKGLIESGDECWTMPKGQPHLPLSYSVKATK